MKASQLLFLLFITLSACQRENPNNGVFEILPSPQQIEINGQSNLKPGEINEYYSENDLELPLAHYGLTENIDLNQTALHLTIDPGLPTRSEGYHIQISNDRIEITGKDQAGLFYGVMTLLQVVEDATEQKVNLPLLEIEDYPLLAYRAIHIDVKHHREKLEYYYELMDRLAKFKINGVIAEVEDKIAYKRQPTIASADALSIEEWEKLSQYALARNIEISPLVQGLGHASFILKHEEYKSLRDDPGSDWAFNPLDPVTYDVQFDLYLDALEALPHGKYLHIGGDEVHTTGRNSGQSALELQLTWLEKVCKFAEQQGRTPIFWDDMPLKHAGVYHPMFDREVSVEKVDSLWDANEHQLIAFIDRFPKNCIYMRWNYRAPETYGNLKAMDWFSSNGFQVMGATAGQTRWSLMPQNQSNIPSIRSFALSSIDKGLDGLLLTLWDDDSPHFELYIRGIMAFAEYTWTGDKKSIDDLKSAYRQRAYGTALRSEDNAFIDLLEKPVGFWKNALLQEGEQRNDLRKFGNPIEEAIIEMPDLNRKGTWSDKYRERLSEANEQQAILDTVKNKIQAAKKVNGRNDYSLEMYEQVADMVEFSFNTLFALEALDQSTEDNEETALEELSKLQIEYSAMRKNLEEVYGKTRLLEKPEDYLLDQDHHTHNANQSISFDWQFYPEMLLLEKIEAFR